jgi:hypothetical protein
MAFDSTLQIPTVCGVPTLKSIVKTNKSGAIAYDSCNARFYAYNPKTLTWTAITGGGSTDTTSLSNRINLKIDSLKRSNDSVYAFINGARFFQYKDSVGGGGGNFWNTSGSTILTNNVNIVTDSRIIFSGNNNEIPRFQVNADSIIFVNSGNGYTYFSGLNSTTDTITYKPLGIDIGGKIAPLTSWVSGGGGVAVDTIFRTLGKDSIFYKKNNITYAIKDSVGTNPPASGYYGAFQDNTSQTAASINTAYAVKLNTTDLTNGVSVVNDGSSNPTRVTLSNTGIYNIQFSLQLEKTGGSGNMIADIWIRKNGIDIPSTTGKVVLTGSANASPVVAAWNYVLDLAAGDYIQLMWSTSNVNVEIVAAVATSPHPAIPSAILTVTQQAGILAGTGITAINSLTGAAQTMVTGTDSTDFKIVSTGTIHKFNLPTASATNRGALSSANWSTFNSKLGASDTVSLSNRINLKLNIADTAAMLAPYTRQRDTIPMFVFGAGSATAGDTAAFSTSAIYGSFYNDFSDTIVLTSFRIGLQGTSPSINTTIYFNDSLGITAGATRIVNAGTTATNIYTGTSVTSLDNTKIPPGNWVWVQTGTLTTKPTYFILTLFGYKSRR